MRWQNRRRSSHVEDRRGRSGAAIGGGLGLGGIILIVLIALLMGENPLALLEQTGGAASPEAAVSNEPRPDDPAAEFVSVVLASTEEVWGSLFQTSGSAYREPTLVLFDRMTPTACGHGTAATGPFYCPGDENLYLDLSFLRQLQQMGAQGDFAVAYVVAHEVGHHVQRLTGIEQQVRALQQRSDQSTANRLSVLMELQADCYAGIWAHYADTEQQLLESGDVQEGLDAAAAVGDDHLQRMAGQAVQPDAFTHGTSQQRMTWFRRGLESGDVGACDTFDGTR